MFSDIQMPGSMDGLKLAHAVHERWPSIKIILVSGQVKLSDADKPTDSLFFGKPLDVKQMIVELRAMVGSGGIIVGQITNIGSYRGKRSMIGEVGRTLGFGVRQVLIPNDLATIQKDRVVLTITSERISEMIEADK